MSLWLKSVSTIYRKKHRDDESINLMHQKQSKSIEIVQVWTISAVTLFTCAHRSAKEHILGLSQVSSAGSVEKTDMFTDDSVFEETIIAEYALVINGHSLVRSLNCSLYMCSLLADS